MRAWTLFVGLCLLGAGCSDVCSVQSELPPRVNQTAQPYRFPPRSALSAARGVAGLSCAYFDDGYVRCSGTGNLQYLDESREPHQQWKTKNEIIQLAVAAKNTCALVRTGVVCWDTPSDTPDTSAL